MPGKLVREAHDGGEQGIGGFGALAERKRPQSQKRPPRQHVPPAPLVGDQFLARDELCLSFDRWSCDTVGAFELGKSTATV